MLRKALPIVLSLAVLFSGASAFAARSGSKVVTGSTSQTFVYTGNVALEGYEISNSSSGAGVVTIWSNATTTMTRVAVAANTTVSRNYVEDTGRYLLIATSFSVTHSLSEITGVYHWRKYPHP